MLESSLCGQSSTPHGVVDWDGLFPALKAVVAEQHIECNEAVLIRLSREANVILKAANEFLLKHYLGCTHFIVHLLSFFYSPVICGVVELANIIYDIVCRDNCPERIR